MHLPLNKIAVLDGLKRFLEVLVLLFLTLPFFVYNIAFAEQAGVSFAKMAFVANVEGNWDLFLVDENGQNLIQLTNSPYDENEPCWSPDRKKIIYSTSDGELNIIDINTKEHYRLPIRDKKDKKTSASFSPSGKEIIYVYFKPKTADDTALAIFDLDKKINKILLDQYGPQYFPSWSPNSKQIVYTNVHCSSECGRVIQELWIADPEGDYARQILMTNSLCMQPVWSPDSKRIAFASDKAGNFDIWILSLEDWKLQQLTTDPHFDVSPAWSREGDKIAFVSTRSGRMAIWIKDLKSGGLKRLAPFPNLEVECKDVAW